MPESCARGAALAAAGAVGEPDGRDAQAPIFAGIVGPQVVADQHDGDVKLRGVAGHLADLLGQGHGGKEFRCRGVQGGSFGGPGEPVQQAVKKFFL